MSWCAVLSLPSCRRDRMQAEYGENPPAGYLSVWRVAMVISRPCGSPATESARLLSRREKGQGAGNTNCR